MSTSLIKEGLHPRNRHRTRYDFKQLIACCPALAAFVAKNAYGDESIDYGNPEAVKALNQALLMHGDEQSTLTAGMGASIPPGTLHSLRNTGEIPLELIAIHMPPVR